MDNLSQQSSQGKRSSQACNISLTAKMPVPTTEKNQHHQKHCVDPLDEQNSSPQKRETILLSQLVQQPNNQPENTSFDDNAEQNDLQNFVKTRQKLLLNDSYDNPIFEKAKTVNQIREKTAVIRASQVPQTQTTQFFSPPVPMLQQLPRQPEATHGSPTFSSRADATKMQLKLDEQNWSNASVYQSQDDQSSPVFEDTLRKRNSQWPQNQIKSASVQIASNPFNFLIEETISPFQPTTLAALALENNSHTSNDSNNPSALETSFSQLDIVPPQAERNFFTYRNETSSENMLLSTVPLRQQQSHHENENQSESALSTRQEELKEEDTQITGQHRQITVQQNPLVYQSTANLFPSGNVLHQLRQELQTSMSPEHQQSFIQYFQQRENVPFTALLEEFFLGFQYLFKCERQTLRQDRENLTAEKQKFASERRHQYEELKADQKRWNENKEKIDSLYTEDVVDLNIGGTHLISTTKNTLTSVKDSSLAAMFSGRHRITTHNGRFFIDRDGEAFTNMLSYLRTGKIPIFCNRNQESAFFDECDYWVIPVDAGAYNRISAYNTGRQYDTEQRTEH